MRTTTWTSRPSSAEVSTRRGVHRTMLADGVGAWFTGATIDGVEDANLAHHVAHVPERLAAARAQVGERTGTDVGSWTLMRQVHGASVALVDERVEPGSELRGVDGMVTVLTDRPLVVLAADCLPILAAGIRAVGVAHAGWRGVAAGVPDALVAAFVELGERPEDLRVAIGPAIGPCCYAVGEEVVAAVTAVAPGTVGRTRGGEVSVDLRAAARQRLDALGVRDVRDAGGPVPAPVCTSCDAGWFSHRRDSGTGRQAGIIVRRADVGRRGDDDERD